MKFRPITSIDELLTYDRPYPDPIEVVILCQASFWRRLKRRFGMAGR
jgi:hypothetical protein